MDQFNLQGSYKVRVTVRARARVETILLGLGLY